MAIVHLQEFTAPEWPDILHAAPLLLIYKHSPVCGRSYLARRSIKTFALSHPDIPVFQVDVLAERALSNRIANDLGVPHASPQVILIADGQVAWKISHEAVTGGAVEIAIQRARTRSPTMPDHLGSGANHG